MGFPGYAGWIVTLDPPAVATGRTELDINSGAIQIGGSAGGTGPDFGQSAITAYEAQQGSYGSTVADFVYPNRTITIPLLLSDDGETNIEDALSDLRQKVGLLQREGGWLLRQREGGQAMYADVVTASLDVPDAWGETSGVEPGVTLILETLPDFFGDEITLDVASATGVLHAVLEQSSEPAVIEGDYPARARILIADTSGNNQLSLLWGLRSRHYDSASTAKLFYEAEALTPVNGATLTSLSGASGGDVVEITALPAGVWVPMLSTDLLAGSRLTHQGSYRVRARAGVYGAVTSAQLRFLWGVGSLSVPEQNDPVQIPGIDALYLLDLGTIRLDAPPVGPNEWFGAWQAMVADTAAVVIDCVYLEPLDESAGQLAYTMVPPPSSTPDAADPTDQSNDSSGGVIAWSLPGGGTATVTGHGLSNWLRNYGYGFAVPSSATISGIQVDITRTTDFGFTFDEHVSLARAGVIETTDYASTAIWNNGGPETFSYGGPTDLWGAAWTPADVNNVDFGVALMVDADGQADVVIVTVTVYYTLASGFTIAQDAVVYADESAELRHDGMYRIDPSGTVYGPVSKQTGDFVRLPPSGMEARPCELFVKPSRGDLDTLEDGGLDGLTAQVIYRPSWMFRP